MSNFDHMMKASTQSAPDAKPIESVRRRLQCGPSPFEERSRGRRIRNAALDGVGFHRQTGAFGLPPAALSPLTLLPAK